MLIELHSLQNCRKKINLTTVLKKIGIFEKRSLIDLDSISKNTDKNVMKKHNFSAGPSILPRVAIENAAKAILDFNGMGLSLLEISHRTPDFEAVNDEAEALLRELLNVPAEYKILFLGGGASTQFYEVPFNLLEKNTEIM